MTGKSPTDVAFTPAIKAQQERLGSRQGYASWAERGGMSDRVSPELASFIAARDSFYLATASADGRPYVQHRGGPKGFLKVLDERTLAFADYSGNRQYVSMGNLSENEKAFLFLMDYQRRERIKIWGRAEFVENDPALLERVTDPATAGRPERVLRFHVEAWDANCPQHIPELIPAATVDDRESDLHDRIRQLEAENARLRG